MYYQKYRRPLSRAREPEKRIGRDISNFFARLAPFCNLERLLLLLRGASIEHIRQYKANRRHILDISRFCRAITLDKLISHLPRRDTVSSANEEYNIDRSITGVKEQ